MKKAWPLPIVLGSLLLSACSSGAKVESEAAVRAALEQYLASRPNLNMQSMDMQVSGMKFRGQTAEVDVTFRAKNDAKASLSMRYTLKRRGGGWEVQPQESGHGTAPAPELPSGHPPVKSQ